MQRIKITDLKAGQRFDGVLFSASGQRLLSPGVELNEQLIAVIQRSGEIEVIVAVSVGELAEAGIIRRADQSTLSKGRRSNQTVISTAGHVLIERGQDVEQHHLDAAAAGGAVYVSKDGNPSKPHERVLLADRVASELERMIPLLELRVNPDSSFEARREVDWGNGYLTDGLVDCRNRSVEAIRVELARVEAGVTVPLSVFEAIIEGLWARLTRNPRQFPQLALWPGPRSDYLAEHIYTVTVLSMAVAAELRWPAGDIRGVGLAGLFFDVGMLLIPLSIRTSGGRLEADQLSRVRRHPFYSVAMLQSVQTVPLLVQLAALQHHERENGGGYPRGARANVLCDYARVLAVADTFAAMTEERPFRESFVPYRAILETLRSAPEGVFWKPAVRALVQVSGLFPIGSRVVLSDQRLAVVVGSPVGDVNRPVVVPLGEDGHPQADQIIDLGAVPGNALSILRAVENAEDDASQP